MERQSRGHSLEMLKLSHNAEVTDGIVRYPDETVAISRFLAEQICLRSYILIVAQEPYKSNK